MILCSQAFNDLQMKVVETQNRVNLADQQIGDLQQKCRRKEIAQKQITSYPDETVMYIGCGKMLVVRDVSLANDECIMFSKVIGNPKFKRCGVSHGQMALET